tara:strand:- start:18376 stop:19428 length:1053 start_codon:yes stop_codon:yes gene_type:complete
MSNPLFNFLPGPVTIKKEILEEFSKIPISHRLTHFVNDVSQLRTDLCDMVSANYCQIITGSGTLANDIIALQLKSLTGQGLVLNSGEFGGRLIDHASRAQLRFKEFSIPWGDNFNLGEIEKTLQKNPNIKWIWLTHCETSSGKITDLSELKNICSKQKVKIVLDCISTIGNMPVNLENVYLASAVSGKGIGSFPGLALVFSSYKPIISNNLPRNLDLGLYQEKQGIPFTVSSNLIYALQVAVKLIDPNRSFLEAVEASNFLRKNIADLGLNVLGDLSDSAPAVTTIQLPKVLNSIKIGNKLKHYGFELSFNSEYLVKRNLIQICLMGNWSKSGLKKFPATLKKVSSDKIN